MRLRRLFGLPDQPPEPTPLEQLTLTMALQAHDETLALRRGQRLIIERHQDDRTPFTITVESMDRYPRVTE